MSVLLCAYMSQLPVMAAPGHEDQAMPTTNRYLRISHTIVTLAVLESRMLNPSTSAEILSIKSTLIQQVLLFSFPLLNEVCSWVPTKALLHRSSAVCCASIESVQRGHVESMLLVHQSGKLMMGTHWSSIRLSLQKRFTLLRAGSLHVLDFCEKKIKKKVRPKLLSINVYIKIQTSRP